MKKLLPIFFALTGLIVQAQNYTALNGPFGGSPSKIIETGGFLLSIANANGVLKSTNGGASWTSSNTGLTNLYINDITKDAVSGKLYAVSYSQLFTSTDNGATWTLTANSGFVNGIFIRKTTSFLYIVGNGTIYRSSNDGTSWGAVNTFTGYPRDFEVNPSGHFFLLTENSGIYRSTNNGLNLDILDGGEGLTDLNLYSLTISGTTLYALSYSGPFKSTNNGTNWASVKANITDCCFGWDSIIEKDQSGNIYAFNGATIWKTTNTGTSWTSFSSPVPSNLYGRLISPYFESSTTFYVGIEGVTLYKTIDSGTSWIPLFSSGLSAQLAHDFLMTDNGRLIYTFGSPFGMHLSIDDGATWDFLASGTTARQITGLLKVGSTVFAYGNGIIKSTDNGSNWTEVNNDNYFDNLVSTDGTNMFSLSQNYNGTEWVWAVRKSANGGSTWTTQNVTGMPATNCSYVPYPQTKEVYLAGNNLIARIYEYCTVNKPSVYKIDLATGAGSEITSVPSTNNINSIDFFNGKLYVFTSNSRLHITNDGGQNWVTKTTTTSNGRIEVIDDNTYYILNSSVFLSTDGGSTWVNTGSPGTTNKWNRHVIVSSANYSYVVQEYGLTYKSNAPVVPPVAPSGLASFGRDRNSVGLIWNDNSNNEDRFVIEASEGDNLSYDSVAQATRPASWSRAQGVAIISSIAGAALKNNTTYYFRIRASGAGGKSAPSNEISVTTLADCTTTSVFPQNRSWTATTLNTSGVGVLTALNQTLTGGNGNYSIQNLPLGAGVGLSPTPQNPWPVNFEENCGSVFVWNPISQYLSNGNGTWDPVLNKLTIPWQTHPQYPLRTETTVYTLNASDPVPAVPTNLVAAVFTPGAILLNWESGTFTLQFEVERSTSSGSGFVKIADVNFPTISYKDLDPALVAGTTYYYRIRAKNATGSSAYTGEVSVIPRSNYLFLPMLDALPGKTFTRTGGGGAWGDVDGDGINDLLLPVTTDSTGLNLAPPLIFKSLGNGQFSKYTIPELADEAKSSRNINLIDINNDGLNDLFISNSNSTDVLLLKQAGGGYFKIPMTEYTSGGIPSASWADYDNDGYIDLLVATWTGLGVASDRILFHNNSGDGTFTKITEGELVTDFGYSRHAQWADYDNDGDQDVLVLNQSTSPTVQSQTRLYKNNGDGTFTRVLGSVFESLLAADRSCSWGDYNNDGHLDVFIAGSSNRLYRNQGDGTFVQVTGSVVEEGQAVTGGSFGSGWGDIDNDGDLDLFAIGFNSILYYNDGDGTFTKYTTQELFNAPNLAKLYGPALEDVDNDGFLDFHNGGFSNPDIANFIYRNTTPASASRRWIKVNLRGTISNGSAIGARVTLVAGGVTQIREVQSHTAQSTQNSLTQHFGVGNNVTITSITVDWPSGLTQTYTGVASNQTLTIIEDGAGPVSATLLPAANATDAPINTKIEITFDEPPLAVAGKTVKVFISGNTTPEFTFNSFDGDVTGNKVSFTPPLILLAAKTYIVEVEEGTFKDQFDNLSPAFAWSFTTLDETGPTIAFIAPSTLNKGFNSTTFSATIEDNSGTVSSAKLSHRKVSGGAFVDVVGVFNSGQGKWEFTVQESFFDASGLEYYISSTDPTGNIGRLPATANFFTHLVYNAENNLVPSERLGFGGTTAGWRIFSVPFELGSNNAISTVLDELNTLEIKKDWRLVTLKDNTTWDEYPSAFSTFTRGKGYFINIRTPIGSGIKLPETTAPTNNRTNLFQISLKAGWNQIGNPYLTPINWSDVVTFNSLTGTAQQLKTYNGSYNNGTSLQPFEGGFVLSANAVTISIPFAGQTAAGGRVGDLDFEEGDWVLPLSLKQGELENNFGGIGMHQQADFSYDQLDDINAPRFLDYIEMNFDHPEHFAKRFARDVVPKQDEYTWTFAVGASLKEDAELSWDNTLLKDLPQDLFLLDEVNQVLVNMREQHTYTLDPKKSTTFKIYFGENLKDKVKPSIVYLGKPFPNPTNEKATISYTLPQGNSLYQVQLEVYNVVGQRVGVLISSEHQPGFYSTTWDTQNNPGGLYFYRLAVSSNGNQQVLTEKIIINR